MANSFLVYEMNIFTNKVCTWNTIARAMKKIFCFKSPDAATEF